MALHLHLQLQMCLDWLNSKKRSLTVAVNALYQSTWCRKLPQSAHGCLDHMKMNGRNDRVTDKVHFQASHEIYYYLH